MTPEERARALDSRNGSICDGHCRAIDACEHEVAAEIRAAVEAERERCAQHGRLAAIEIYHRTRQLLKGLPEALDRIDNDNAWGAAVAAAIREGKP